MKTPMAYLEAGWRWAAAHVPGAEAHSVGGLGVWAKAQTYPEATALGWTLLHFCWQGMVVGALLWCGLRLLGGRASRVRYAFACLALTAMVALPVATFVHLAVGTPRDSTVTLPTVRIELVAPEMGNGVPVLSTVPRKVRVSGMLDEAVAWVPAVWLVGVLLFLGRLNLGLMVARRMKSAGTDAPPLELQRVFDELKARLGIGRAVRLMNSALVQVPTVIGWLRPVVLLPVGCFMGLSAMQVEALLAHELAHIRRHDYLVSVLQSVVEALLFYHPAVWWVSRQVRRERECCCDEIAAAVGGDRLAYAKALSWLEEHRAAMPEIVLGANGGVLTMRIKRLLGRGGPSISSQLAAGVVLAILVAGAGSYVVTTARAEAGAASRAARVTSPLELEPVAPLNALIASPAMRKFTMLQQPAGVGGSVAGSRNNTVYTEWLNQDVLWIITPEERNAFLNLSNDDERDKFIDQFWARRNPPGAPANSFKSEYYARIAYSNQHFATNDGPGWRSDRGRIYLIYGKPESIEAHPSGEAYPYEVWHYRLADGHELWMKFEDTCDCGRYLLVSQKDSAADTVNGPTLNTVSSVNENSKAVQAIQEYRLMLQQFPDSPRAGEATRRLRELTEQFASADLPPAYKHWLAEDVVWIIGPEELDAFLHLTNDEERDKFIEQFWERRNPTPGAAENLYRDEHYSRIAYANEHFGVNGVSGWRTDRGRTYILYGSPESVDSHPNGGQTQANMSGRMTSPFPFEVWHYPGGGENSTLLFVDTCGCGLYNYMFDPPDPRAPAARTGPPEGALRVSSGTMQANLISKPDPIYPDIAKAAHVQGAVTLHAIVSKTGAVEALNVIDGPAMLGQSSMEAVRQWKYKPFLLNGEPVRVETTITVNYTIGN